MRNHRKDGASSRREKRRVGTLVEKNNYFSDSIRGKGGMWEKKRSGVKGDDLEGVEN